MWRRSSTRRAISRRAVRLRLEALEPRALLASVESGDTVSAAPDSPAEAFSLVGDSGAAEQPVWLESDGPPAPPPEKTPSPDAAPVQGLAEVVVERPFLTGILKITQLSKTNQRFQIDAPRGKAMKLVAYVKQTAIFGYEDHGDYVVVYPEPEVRDRPRSSIEYHFDGTERSVRYFNMSQKFVQERQHVSEATYGSLSSKGIYTESYEFSTEEVRLFQRNDELYDEHGARRSTRTSHIARNGDSVELEVGAVEGGSARITQGAEQLEFTFVGRVEVDRMYYFDVNSYAVRGVRGKLAPQATGVELAKITVDALSVKSQVVAEETPLATQAFGSGTLEVFDLRTVAFDRAEKRARVVVTNPRNGKPHELLLLTKVSGFEINDQGALVVRNVEQSHKTTYVFSPDGAVERTELSGPLVKTDTRKLSDDVAGVGLQLVRERWAREEDGLLRLKQDRILSPDARGDLSVETYLRYLDAEERAIWSRSLYDRAQPVWLTYISQMRAETLQLVSITRVEFDQFGWLSAFEGLHRFGPDLLQRMIEIRVEETGLHVGFRLDPRPMLLRRAFGDGELLLEQRPNFDRFVYLIDAAGSVLFERKLESYSINNEYVLVEYDDEVSLIRPDGTLAAVTFVPFGDSRIEVRETRGLDRAGGRLTPLERAWHLGSRELQKETYEHAADGSLLAVRLKRNPLEWLEEDESPTATFTLDSHVAERAAKMFLSYTRTGQLRDLGVRHVVFAAAPELVRDAAGLVQTVRGYALAADGEARFWQLEYAAQGARLNERVLFEARFGTAADERIGRIAAVERLDQEGARSLIIRFSGQPLVANRADWHPFDLFFAAQPLVEYEILGWTAAGDRLAVTRLDGSQLTVWADETSVVFDTEQSWASSWGLLTTRTSLRPTHNFGAGEGLLLLPFRQEIVAADGGVWQSEGTEFQSPLLGEPAVASRSLVCRLADGRTVEYRQKGEVHVLAVTTPDEPHAVKRYRLLSSPQLDRWPETGLTARISGQIAGPAGPQDISLELFG